MTSRSIAWTLAGWMACALLACGSGDNAEPAAPEANQPSATRADGPDPFARPDASSGPHPATFAAACEAKTKMPAAMCQCMSDQADEQLVPATRDFLIAQLGGNRKRAEKLRAKLPSNELSAAGTFMMNAASACRAKVAK